MFDISAVRKARRATITTLGRAIALTVFQVVVVQREGHLAQSTCTLDSLLGE